MILDAGQGRSVDGMTIESTGEDLERKIATSGTGKECRWFVLGLLLLTLSPASQFCRAGEIPPHRGGSRSSTVT